MRLIKFRAWSSKTNKMIDDIYHWDSEGYAGIIPQTPDLVKSLTPMQFTGLLDKNGVEIYEGDIVMNAYRQVVEYGSHQGVEGGKHDEYIGYNLNPNNMQFTEVIGNIYENPELLEIKREE